MTRTATPPTPTADSTHHTTPQQRGLATVVAAAILIGNLSFPIMVQGGLIA